MKGNEQTSGYDMSLRNERAFNFHLRSYAQVWKVKAADRTSY